jgi:hypothetical protein
MLDPVIADVQDLQLLQLIHVLNLADLVFLEVQLAQGMLQGE